MASLRDQILEAGAARINALGGGWVATTRNVRTPQAGEKQAILVDERENKVGQDSWYYAAELQVAVVIRARVEKAAGGTFGGDVYRYLDALVVEVEKVVHADPTPFSWGVAGVTAIDVMGHTKFEPDKNNIAVAKVDLKVRYRHDFANPEAYTLTPIQE